MIRYGLFDCIQSVGEDVIFPNSLPVLTVQLNIALRDAQTLRAGCSKAESKKISPRRRPLPGSAGRPKSNQLEMVTTFTYRPSLVRIDARNFELSW